MIELPRVSERIVALADIALFSHIPSAGIPGGQPTSRSLQTIAEFLREVIRNPYPQTSFTLPAIPASPDSETDGGNSSKKRGMSPFRPPGSPAETIYSDAPSTIWAKRCLEIVERLLTALDGKSKNVPKSLINDAIEFGALIPKILEFYDGRFESGLDRYVKRNAHSASQREKALKNVKLTQEQWQMVKTFIGRKVKEGVSAAEACRQAERQLKTGKFPKIEGRIHIGADALRRRWTNRLKPSS